jgi:hypothetical protein
MLQATISGANITQNMERRFGDALNGAAMVLPRVPPR